MKLYYLKTCDTCRAAKRALAPRSPDLVEIRDDGLDRDTIAHWLEKLGPDVLLNRKSRTWRALSEQEREGPAVELILENPTVMKRPVIVDGSEIHVGWTMAVKRALNLP